jgi:two-component system LytT family response regulator
MNSLVNALIVDDEPDVRQGLRALLGAHPEVQIIGEAGSVAEALVFLQSQAPDVLFLDMEMPGGSGLELERSLDRSIRTVFVTAYPDYALKAFHFGAVDYLLKPVDPDRLALTIERLLGGVPESISSVSLVLDCVGITGQLARIRISEILWIEAFQNYTRVFTANDQNAVLYRQKMSVLEGLLPADLFVRVGRGEIIQLARVKAVRWTSRDVNMVSFDGSDSRLQLGRTSALRLKAIIKELAAGKQ